MKKAILKLKWWPIFALVIGIVAVSCEDDEKDPVWQVTTDVTSIALDMNDKDALTATITASTTKDGVDATESYKFTSSDPLVASVSDAGLVTAVGGGSTTIEVEGLSSAKKVTVAVTVKGEEAPTIDPIYELNGSIKYTWDPTRLSVTDVVVFDEQGEAELVQAIAGSDYDKNAIDYVFEEKYDEGWFILSPERSDKFKAGVNINVKITTKEAEEPVWKRNVNIHNKLSASATINSISFEWDIVSVNSGIVPANVLVYLRTDPVNDGDPYGKGEAVSNVEVSAVDGDTLIMVSGLVSNESYYYEIVDAESNVLFETNSTIPSPITQIKAGNTESVWYGDASSAGNKTAECRRIADRISIGQGLTYDQIAKVEVKNASGTTLVELGEWAQNLAVYEYSYINTDAPNVMTSFDAAVALKAAYVHDKIDPEDGKNGEFKYFSFYDLPYSEGAYTVVVTTKDSKTYEKTYNTKKKYSVRNRAQVRANDVIYADAATINAKNLKVMYYSNIPGDAPTFEMSDPAVATINNEGLINFVANGISKVTIAGEGGTFNAEVAAAKTYCNNYAKFQGMTIATGEQMTFWSPDGYKFASAVSNNEAVANVGGEAGDVITAVAEGSAVITITDDQGYEAKMTVTVVSAPAE